MPLRDPRSAKIAVFFLIPIGTGIYHHWYQWRQFAYLRQFHFGADRITLLVLSTASAAYFLWRAFRGQPVGADQRRNSLAVGLCASILAITFTLSGLGYEHHALKIIVVAFLYSAAGIFFWYSYKGYPLGVVKDN